MGAMRTAAGLAYREAGPAGAPVALLLHGYPESSYMWRDLLPVVAAAGRRALAPDLAGMGDSEPDLPGSWERHTASIERFRSALGIERCVLILHDWGGLIGLRWACEHPDAVEGLVISSSGFFSDGKWHGMAEAMRTPGTGEEILAGSTRDGLAAVLRQVSRGIDADAVDEYWKAYGDEARRQGQLDFYRSMDFEKLAPYEGRLAELDVPALLVWGEKDPFAPLSGARRFERTLRDPLLVVAEGAGHFVWEDAPGPCGEAVSEFLRRLSAS
jgi:haloalkane dehalogenase